MVSTTTCSWYNSVPLINNIQLCYDMSGFWWGNLRERDHWGGPDADGRIILRWIFRKWEGVVRTGWSWLRIGTGGRHLWVQWWTLGFQKCGEFFWLAAEPVSFSRRTLLHGVQPLVAVGGRVVCRSEVHFRPAYNTATDTEWQLPQVVLTQFVSPDDEHDVLETCRELKI